MCNLVDKPDEPRTKEANDTNRTYKYREKALKCFSKSNPAIYQKKNIPCQGYLIPEMQGWINVRKLIIQFITQKGFRKGK